ncbi:hypothetical protein M409DRAFT_66389 [Zasmidium cellare ATCC 36951]|uniref:Enoyl reductase (ER) domain-containing protein n=1 Tax=Zasmidium cellare ATCC 36951 TaxID=1080233 RepID=A0A6A6CN03_ZASCE|nr:uncharacterized protein M409DRAFT_66389 [Zasmidium cellare ATCC 36951]KAF2166826.1 hypothetical protein M409DRAFT_66389 [Zasmidium cellare ATCC 36951]
MLAITSPTYSDPSGYELSEIPLPKITEPDEVIIRVHAASINPVDVKIASGAFKQAGLLEAFPIRLGYDCAGVVTEVGKDVRDLKVGDKVWSRLPESTKGSWSEYAKATPSHISLMPTNLSFAEAASLPLAAITAVQALRKYEGDLAGKTVFVPAGLGGTGAFACQLAKNVFKAGKVITTVSTAKVGRVAELLGEGVVDQIIDYTKEDPTTIIPRGSIDFLLDTMGQALSYLSLMTPHTSTIMSISTTPSGTQLQSSSFFSRPSNPKIPWLVKTFLDGADYVRKLRARRWGVRYEYMFLESGRGELDALRGFVEEGRLRAVVGSRVALRDAGAVREACGRVYQGKGGVGKTVFEVVGEGEG